MREAGFHVEVSGDAERGFARLASEHFDVLLCDLKLPGESGFGLCRRVKQSDELRMIPVVLLTHHADAINCLRGLEAGADGFLTGEASFHDCLFAEHESVCLLLVGHYASERFAVESLAEHLQQQLPDVTIWPARTEQDPIAQQ